MKKKEHKKKDEEKEKSDLANEVILNSNEPNSAPPSASVFLLQVHENVVPEKALWDGKTKIALVDLRTNPSQEEGNDVRMARANTCFQVPIQMPVRQVTSTQIKCFKEVFYRLFRKRMKKRPKGDRCPKSRCHGQLCMGICVILAWPPLHGIEILCMATLHQVGVFLGGLIKQVKV